MAVLTKPHSFNTSSSVPRSKHDTKNSVKASLKFSTAFSSVGPCEWTSSMGHDDNIQFLRFLSVNGSLKVKTNSCLLNFNAPLLKIILFLDSN